MSFPTPGVANYDGGDGSVRVVPDETGGAAGVNPMDGAAANTGRFAQETSMWVGDLDPYMDEAFLREAVLKCGWGQDIVRIKVVSAEEYKAGSKIL